MSEAPVSDNQRILKPARPAVVQNQYSTVIGAEQTEKHPGNVSSEIAESKLAERSWREERGVLTAVLDAPGTLIVVLQPDRKIAGFNRACERMTGYRFEEVSGRCIGDLFLRPAEAGQFGVLLENLRESPGRAEYESCWVMRDGSERFLNCSATAVLPGGKQAPPYIIISGTDVTGQRRAEKMLHALLEAAPDAIAVVNQSGNVILMNAQVETLFGYRREELLGKGIERLLPAGLHGNRSGRWEKLFAEPRAGRIGADIELYGRHKDGREFPVEVSLGPIETEEGVLISGTIRDISHRKRLESAVLEISERERHRLGRDLHDGLGQHLTGIAFMSKVLAERLAGEPEELVPEAVEAAKIVRLVNDAIGRARELARGLLPVVWETGGLASALKQCAAEMEDLFGVTCRFECQASFSMENVNVATHLYHITREALNNAMKHGNAKVLQIELSSRNGEGELSISDNGTGLPEGLPNNQGRGLDIMTYRARMVGGTLRLLRNPAGGATVFCVFPMPIADVRGGASL